MPLAPSSSNPGIQRSNRTLCGFIFRLGLVVTWFSLPFLHWGHLVHTEIYGERSFVVATVDEWWKGGSKDPYHYIKATLSDGSEITATANLLGRVPPESGEKIQLVKIVSVLGWTNYRWEPPPLTLKDFMGKWPN